MPTPNPQRVADDQPTRDRIAQELNQNFLVEAAAGTGKTTSIVQRMVALVASGACRIDQLAAVTFTRKAGAELRERFQGELLRRLATLPSPTNDAQRQERFRLQVACDGWSQAFVGTIHSFCAALLRERPIEFGVDPAFQELDESDDLLLQEQAWHDNINDLLATRDPLIAKLKDLGIERREIKSCFHKLIDFRDIHDWPSKPPDGINVEELKSQTRDYIEHMRQLLPSFTPAGERGNDKLMERYETLVRVGSREWSRDSAFFDILERFDTSSGEVQKAWHSVDVARGERDRWKRFRDTCAIPGMDYWRRYRYRFLIDFLRRAVGVYERLKRFHCGLDFQDLLLIVSSGLKAQAELRSYFQQRYTHLLVDEFQDTDPVQAEMMLYLASSNTAEVDWSRCQPRPGCLFLVGDPKQSIYRFRRGDIVTYNRVKEIFMQTGGEVLALVRNFRSREELIQWNNALYQGKFGRTATEYAPAAEDMLVGRQDASQPAADKTIVGMYRLELPTDESIAVATEFEADAIARLIRYWIDQRHEVSRTEREVASGRSSAVEPRDFLIIPWGKKMINVFTAALERYELPYEVAGGNPLQTNAMLQSLIDCLLAIDDPYDPVHFLALLRRFFGFNDRELFLFKEAGGQFNFLTPIPTGLSEPLHKRIGQVVERLGRYQQWMRSLPYVTAVVRIAEDLGLFAKAAAASEGNMQAGGLFKAIERLRQQNWDFDSASDVIQFLQEVLDAEETDGCTALAPDANVVRIMNLHKAKGLEAPIVFLADTAGKWDRPISSHIDRRGDHPRGYFGITEEKGKWRGTRNVATPENWDALQEEEKRFLDAEAERLLYVATTRAACASVVSIGKSKSNWSSLHAHLMAAPAVDIPNDKQLAQGQAAARSQSQHRSSLLGDAAGEATCVESLSARWRSALTPSYAVVSAKKVGLRGKSRPKWEASGDYGYLWGSAVHELLELRHKLPDADLRASGLQIAAEYQLGSQRLDELLATVDAVAHSPIWHRAQGALACYSELPIETLYSDGGDEHPTLLRGVIDLIFKEQAGWVIVDYKTDDITTADIPSAVDYYRSQLQQYAHHWQQITGEKVVELGLYFTRIDAYHPVA